MFGGAIESDGIIGDGGDPCLRCEVSDSVCSYDKSTVFVAREWTPLEAGLPVVKPPPIVNRPYPPRPLTDQSFINETQAVEGQYTVLSQASTSPITQPSFTDFTPSPNQFILPPENVSEPVKSSEDAFYLDRYCYILGPWLDVFDVNRNFSLVVPHLSLSNPVLRVSLLAWAAKQYYLTHLTQPADTALSYYDRAISMMTASLSNASHSCSPAVFASCLLLSVCEMMGDSYQEWQLHLEGTYRIIVAHGWHGCSGGVGEATFWIYCRMDILSALALGEPTRLDTALWLPLDNALAPNNGLDGWTVDAWSNYTVLLFAQIHNLLCKVRKERVDNALSLLMEDWNALQEKVDAHDLRKPPQFAPLAVLEIDEKSNENPFPPVRYLSETICFATQIFDVARLHLILARPERSRQDRIERFAMHANSFMIYAKRVVGNSINNRHDSNWIAAPLLLTVAGLALIDWAERKALLNVLKSIHAQTGWDTRDNIHRLLTWWEWAAPLNERGRTWNDVHQEIGPRVSAADRMWHMYNTGIFTDAARREGQNRG